MTANASDSTQFCGLSNAHDVGIQFRPVAFLPVVLTKYLSKELWRRLRPLTELSNNSIDNAKQVMTKQRAPLLKKMRLRSPSTSKCFILH